MKLSSNIADPWLDAVKAGVLPTLAAFSIAFPIRFNSIVCVSMLAIYGVMFWRSNQSWRPMLRSWIFILIAAHVAVLLIGLTYTPNVKAGLEIIERYSFALLCVALVYMMSRLGVTLNQVVLAFAAGVTSVILYGFSYAIFGLNPSERAAVFLTGHTSFTDIIRIHPAYLGMYLIFLFFFAIEYARLNHQKLNAPRKWLLLVVLVCIILVVVFLRSQINLLIFPLLLLIYGIVIMRKRAALVTFMLFAVGFLVYLVDNERVGTFFDRYGKNVSTALEHRIQIWKASIEAIREAPFFGSGTGGAQIDLNEQYSEMGYSEGVEQSYNAHNQYLQALVRNGLLEFSVLAALLAYCFYKSLQYSNYSFLLFIMLVMLSMMAESCLSVQKGIVFFYFFTSAFLFLPGNPTSKAEPKA